MGDMLMLEAGKEIVVLCVQEGVVFKPQPALEGVANVGALAMCAARGDVDGMAEDKGRAGIQERGMVSREMWGLNYYSSKPHF